MTPLGLHFFQILCFHDFYDFMDANCYHVNLIDSFHQWICFNNFSPRKVLWILQIFSICFLFGYALSRIFGSNTHDICPSNKQYFWISLLGFNGVRICVILLRLLVLLLLYFDWIGLCESNLSSLVIDMALEIAIKFVVWLFVFWFLL